MKIRKSWATPPRRATTLILMLVMFGSGCGDSGSGETGDGDPEPLWGCDDATISLSQNGFVVGNANSGELLYELGLRNGDIIVSVNGFDLDDYSDVGVAVAELWFTEGETVYSLVIERNSSPMTLNYHVAATF